MEQPRRRDAALALVTLTLLTAISIRAGAWTALLEWTAAIAGSVGAAVAEAVLARRPAAVRAVWEHRTVQVGALLVACLLGVGAARASDGGFVLAVLVWGLVAYLVLLAGVEVKRRRSRRQS